MDTLIEQGIDWIVSVQSLGSWLELPMLFFTALGNENFAFLGLPLLYWSVDARLGVRVALILITSNYFNGIFKLLFAGPRPFWVSTRIEPFLHEDTFGIPSGHAQNAVTLWGALAAWINRPWSWAVAGLLAFLIGFSRLYLGVHFVHDVVAGWVIGSLLLFGFLKFWDPVSAWLLKRTVVGQIAVAFLVSMLMVGAAFLVVAPLDGYVLPEEWAENAGRAGSIPDPVSVEDSITAAATLFGLAAGLAWIASLGGYDASGPLEKRALRYGIGLVGVAALWIGLRQLFPGGETAGALILRYVRYSLVGFWISGAAPWLFFHFKLAGRSRSEEAPLL